MQKNNSKVSILVVCNEFPIPANHGGRIDVIMSLKRLQKMFDKVDLLYVDWAEASATDLDQFKDLIDGEVNYIRRTKSIFDFLSFVPFQQSSRKGLREFCSTNNYDVVFVHSDYCVLFFESEVAINSTCRILRNHNCESKYFKSLSRTQFPLSLKFGFYLSEYLKFLFYEKFILKKLSLDTILFISNEEYSISRFPKKMWVPPSIEIDAISEPSQSSNRVTFVGSLFMDNNMEGLLWYLEKVHPLIIERSSEYLLVIAGNPRNKDVSFLNNYPRVELFLSPGDDELNEIYKSSSVFISPMFNGAGVKLKTVNAIVNGLAVVGTKIGCEGVGLKDHIHAYITDIDDIFADSVLRLLEDEKLRVSMIKSAQSHIIDNFNVDYNEIFSNNCSRLI